jgi:uncharacterized membrane protein YgdD (TMEM256/DUF423 family)
MHKRYFIYSALLGAIGVALGAFGAHGLQKITTDEKIISSYQTAVQYQLYHSLALLITTSVADKLNTRYFRLAAIFFLIGILLFSGSLYLITLLKIQESSLVKFIGPVTPLGGLLLITGWLLLALAAINKKRL